MALEYNHARVSAEYDYITFWVDAVELRSAEQRVDDRGTLAAGVRTGEEIVFAAECDGTQRAFRGVVVDLDAPVFAVARECTPT